MRSDIILDRLLSLHPVVIDLSLERLQRLLDALGNPERHLPPVVHIAGTNGKGSTHAIMRACLEAAGYKVHAYTSPHLVRFHERIRLAGTLIDEEALSALLARCEDMNDGLPITFFEVTTAAALLAFSETPADILLLEVGLGGRFDATNVIDHPAMTVITPVSQDHAQFLGTDLGGIAREKAGILKTGSPAVISRQHPVAADAITSCADGLSVRPLWFGTDFTPEITEDGFSLAATNWPHPALDGLHQVDNAATAIMALKGLAGFDIPDAAIRQGLENVTWPARLQQLDPAWLNLDPSISVWLDGGHNPDAAEKLATHIAGFDAKRPVHMITGLLNTKDASGYFTAFASGVTVHCVTIPGEANALTAKDIAGQAGKAGLAATASNSIEDALNAIPAGSNLVISGSLYLAGHILAMAETRYGQALVT